MDSDEDPDIVNRVADSQGETLYHRFPTRNYLC